MNIITTIKEGKGGVKYIFTYPESDKNRKDFFEKEILHKIETMCSGMDKQGY